ncbi:hypothetical protein [Streptomyces sp. NPDC020965]
MPVAASDATTPSRGGTDHHGRPHRPTEAAPDRPDRAPGGTV